MVGFTNADPRAGRIVGAHAGSPDPHPRGRAPRAALAAGAAVRRRAEHGDAGRGRRSCSGSRPTRSTGGRPGRRRASACARGLEDGRAEGQGARLHLLRGRPPRQARRRLELEASSATVPREVFSITKSVTSALVGIAIRDGDLRLDDRVSTLRPAVARHRVGDGHRPQPALQRQRPLLVADVRLHRPAQGPEPHGVRRRAPPAVRPGSAWAYNNAAIQVLEPVLEQATGMPVATFAADPALRAARHDALHLHHRPGRRRRRLLRPADHVPRPGPLRHALPRRRRRRRHAAARPVLRQAVRRPVVDDAQRGLRLPVVAQPPRPAAWRDRPGGRAGPAAPARPPASWHRPCARTSSPRSASAARCCSSTRQPDDGDPPRPARRSRAPRRTASTRPRRVLTRALR